MFGTLQRRWPSVFHGALPVVFIVCFVNYRAMLQYGGCYVTEQWDWVPYGRNLLEAFFGHVQF
jgi:hypothetical protein